jgi:hypothetical protein
MSKMTYSPKCFPCSACGKLKNPKLMSWVRRPRSNRVVRTCQDCYVKHMNIESFKRGMCV